ncbi:MAG: copper chaperone [Candidatus Symbiothrix sp.]|nr:copper chaperone [Candidatus Symbiothrix sp.]
MKQFIYLMISVAMIVTVNACSKTTSDKKAETSTEAPATETESTITHAHLAVNGSCEMCKERIESTAKAVEGVAGAEWDDEEQQLHLNFDTAETSLETISKALAQAGHDTEFDKAPDEVYNALPACCKYRK